MDMKIGFEHHCFEGNKPGSRRRSDTDQKGNPSNSQWATPNGSHNSKHQAPNCDPDGKPIYGELYEWLEKDSHEINQRPAEDLNAEHKHRGNNREAEQIWQALPRCTRGLCDSALLIWHIYFARGWVRS
jgi:hypothetical protein